MQKEQFKKFVRNNPNLINHVRSGKMTWQKFYELYDLYGENNSIWDDYISEEPTISNNTQNSNVIGTIKDLFGLFKGVDLGTVQKTLGSLEKAIGTFKDFNTSNNSRNANVGTSAYEERPMYKYFED